MSRLRLLRRSWIAIVAASVMALLPSVPAGADVPDGQVRPDFEAPHSPDQVIVRFKDTATSSKRQSIAKSQNMVKQDTLAAADVETFRITDGDSPEKVVGQLQKMTSVLYAEPDYRLQSDAISNDPRIGNYWGLNNTGQSVASQVGIAGIDTKASQAWANSTGSGVVVAVVDEGVDWNHPDLASRIWTNDDCFSDGIDHDNNGYVNDCRGWDFYHNDKTPFDAADGDEHGTHVAGTIAAVRNNNIGGAGVAPDVKIMPLKFLGPDGGDTSDAIRAIQYAKANGARIVNCSWGGGAPSTALRDAMANSGMLFTTAAGNDAKNIGSQPQYPAAYSLANQITVAAVDNRGRMASFSNYGGTTSMGAPGVGIQSTIPKAVTGSVALTNDIGSARTAYWGFGLEDVSGADARRRLLALELERMGANASSPVLIVDDDESESGNTGTPDTAGFYRDALAAGGFTNVSTYEVSKDERGPGSAEMAGKFVIWQTGYAVGSSSATTIASGDLLPLTNFVNGGGKLLVAGADAIWRNEDKPFVINTLGVSLLKEGDTRTEVNGVNGKAFSGMSFMIDGQDSPRGAANAYRDIVEPSGSSTSALELHADATYDNAYGYLNGTSMATPHVAGAAALVASVAPSASAISVGDYLRNNTTALSAMNGKTASGGILNAKAAVDAALGFGAAITPGPAPAATGYRFVAADGGIFSYGGAAFKGSTGGQKLNAPIVGMATTADRNGYWLAGRDGSVFSFGAPNLGAANEFGLNRPIVGISATPSGDGYWLVASDGGIFSFGDAEFFGSTGDLDLNKPIVGMAPTPSGNGYWLVASDGGIFSYGDARFFGSTGALTLNKPIVGMTPTPSGNGYWLVASDGGIFSYGDARFFGSAGSLKLNQPITGISSSGTGNGYWLVASDGGVFSYGDAPFHGSTGSIRLNQPIVAMSR